MDTQVIVNVILVLVVAYVGYLQHNRIKQLQQSFDAQKTLLDALTSYSKVFNVDEFHKYMALREENLREEARRAQTEALNKLETHLLKDRSNPTEDEVNLLSFALDLLVLLPPEHREAFILERMKGTLKEPLLTVLPQMQVHYLPSWPEWLAKQLREQRATK